MMFLIPSSSGRGAAPTLYFPFIILIRCFNPPSLCACTTLFRSDRLLLERRKRVSIPSSSGHGAEPITAYERLGLDPFVVSIPSSAGHGAEPLICQLRLASHKTFQSPLHRGMGLSPSWGFTDRTW